ncbi:Hypothetical predicted protein [Octopus vulgaris]|uniref:Uncharacterized protein n=3 Tax=Octopus TaxID=6643 RepID=A0AA36BFP9_OCTVU|nr:uncharacterized protein LOC115219362 [Octopus sinensis]CAI9733575.1 Hypothetical predicted protein [Octopus vulgaris]
MNSWSVNMDNGTTITHPHQFGFYRWNFPNMTFPASFQIPEQTSHNCDLSPTQTMLPKSYLDYQMKLNDLCQQRSTMASTAVSSPMNRKILLKTQLMRVLLARQRPGYLEFLQRYAAEQVNSFQTSTSDYLDHIRQNATEDFHRNGIEVSVIDNDFGRNHMFHQENSLINNIADSEIKLGRARISNKRSCNAISYQFTSTSLSNHENVDESVKSCRHTCTGEFYIPQNSKKNSFRHLRSRRPVNGTRKTEIINKESDVIRSFTFLQRKRPRHVGQYHSPSNDDEITASKRDPLDSCRSNLETDFSGHSWE